MPLEYLGTLKHSLKKLSCGYPVVILNKIILLKNLSTIFILSYFYKEVLLFDFEV